VKKSKNARSKRGKSFGGPEGKFYGQRKKGNKKAETDIDFLKVSKKNVLAAY